MRSFVLYVVMFFSFSYVETIYATGRFGNCVYAHGYYKHTVLLELDSAEFVYVASAETEEVAGRKAIFHPLYLLIHSKFPELLMLPFSVSINGMQKDDILINWETGVATDLNTGVVNDNVVTNKEGHSAWVRQCSYKKKKHIQVMKIPEPINSFQYINF